MSVTTKAVAAFAGCLGAVAMLIAASTINFISGDNPQIALENASYDWISYEMGVGFIIFLIAVNRSEESFIKRFEDWIVLKKSGRLSLAAYAFWTIFWTFYSAAFSGRHRYECLFNCGYKWHLYDWLYYGVGIFIPALVAFLIVAALPVIRRILNWIGAGE